MLLTAHKPDLFMDSKGIFERDLRNAKWLVASGLVGLDRIAAGFGRCKSTELIDGIAARPQGSCQSRHAITGC
jgi:hypothetical protein